MQMNMLLKLLYNMFIVTKNNIYQNLAIPDVDFLNRNRSFMQKNLMVLLATYFLHY